MPQGHCVNFGECGKAERFEVLEVAYGAEFLCPECGEELFAVRKRPPWLLRLSSLPPAVKIASLCILFGLLISGGIIALTGSARDSGAEERASTVSEGDGEALTTIVEDSLARRLATEYSIRGHPIIDKASSPPDYVFRVPLGALGSLYRVAIIDLVLPSSMPAVLHDLADHLKVHPGLPPGRTYDTENALRTNPDTDLEGVWHVRIERAGNGWRLSETTEPLVVRMVEAGVDHAVVSAARLGQLKAERLQSLEIYGRRWGSVERDIARFGSEAERSIPTRCQKDMASLLSEVVQLTSDCPRILIPDERNACFVRRDRLNSEIGQCEVQNRLHEEGGARLRSAVEDFRNQSMRSFIDEIHRESGSPTATSSTAGAS